MRKKLGRPAELSRNEIVEAALALLEAGGPRAITMARVAEAVGASPMGLYRHVAGREELLAFMLVIQNCDRKQLQPTGLVFILTGHGHTLRSSPTTDLGQSQ